MLGLTYALRCRLVGQARNAAIAGGINGGPAFRTGAPDGLTGAQAEDEAEPQAGGHLQAAGASGVEAHAAGWYQDCRKGWENADGRAGR